MSLLLGILMRGGGIVDNGSCAISARTVTSQAQTPTVPLAQIAFRSVANGNLETRILGQAWQSISGEWFVDGVETDMELLVTTTSGSPSGNPAGWVSGVREDLSTGTDLVWARNDTSTAGGFNVFTATYEIFHKPSGDSLAGPATITIRARQLPT